MRWTSSRGSAGTAAGSASTAWPPYYLAPVVRSEVLDANPEIAAILNAVSAKLDTETMVSLNAKVDIDHMEYEEVAREFYETVCK